MRKSIWPIGSGGTCWIMEERGWTRAPVIPRQPVEKRTCSNWKIHWRTDEKQKRSRLPVYFKAILHFGKFSKCGVNAVVGVSGELWGANSLNVVVPSISKNANRRSCFLASRWQFYAQIPRCALLQVMAKSLDDAVFRQYQRVYQGQVFSVRLWTPSPIIRCKY